MFTVSSFASKSDTFSEIKKKIQDMHSLAPFPVPPTIPQSSRIDLRLALSSRAAPSGDVSIVAQARPRHLTNCTSFCHSQLSFPPYHLVGALVKQRLASPTELYASVNAALNPFPYRPFHLKVCY